MISLCVYACVEPFQTEFEDFESALVIEATITNEQKFQNIFLTRTFKFDDDDPNPESNAKVQVIGNDNTWYDFSETEAGLYTSDIMFSALPDVNYQLQIQTSDGRYYSSTEVSIASVTTIDAIRAERIINDDNDDGIAILVNSFDPTRSSLNYRYTYEETYKVIPPKWASDKLIIDPDVRCGVLVVPKDREERICYATDYSNNIVLTNTSDLVEDRVSDFMVRFLKRDNYIISYRYSILVKQYVQSNMAFSFYKTLNDFTSDESLFSETQPGFLEGNISSTQNNNERVLGFFDVSSVTEKRLFFNYDDFYPNEPLPPFPWQCLDNAPPLVGMGGACVLSAAVAKETTRYFKENGNPQTGEGPYLIVPRVCGDCTVLGKTIIPDFWTD